MIFYFLLLLLSPAPAFLPLASSCTYCTHHHPHHRPAILPPPPPPPPAEAKCSLDILKLGLCLDVLGGLVHVGLAPAENYCCPVLQGLLELEAAACLCTAIQLKVLNLNVYIPLALQLLIACGKDPPPGYLCPLLA